MTRGRHGMALFDAEGSGPHPGARERRAVDVTGAGDTVIASSRWRSRRARASEAARLANVAGSLVVQKRGRRRCPGRALESCGAPMSTLDKLRPLAAMAEERWRGREEGQTVALANGVFDLLHVGTCATWRGRRSWRTSWWWR